MKLSLCTIIRDDAMFVKRLLESVVGVVDEIVIADTGSSDGTLEIIQSFSNDHEGLVKLLQFQWIDDFSAARNFVLEHAACDWALVLDGDEFLESCDIQNLRPVLTDTPHDGFLIKIRNYIGSLSDVQNATDVENVRLFRGHHRYVGTIHEQIDRPILEKQGSIESFPFFTIHHLGYLAEYRELKQKGKRNTELLRQQIRSIKKRDKSERWFAMSNLLGEYEAAEEWGELTSNGRLLLNEIRAIKVGNRPHFTVRIYRQYVTGLRKLGRYEEALRSAREAASLFAKHTDTLMMLAQTYMDMHRYTEALGTLKRCRELGDVRVDTSDLHNVGAGTHVAAAAMGYCWLKLGDDVTAREWYMTSFAEEMDQQAALSWLVLLTPDRNTLHEMEKLLHTPKRYKDFLFLYALTGYDDAPIFITRAKQQWGEQEFIRCAEFAFAIRKGSAPLLPEQPTIIDYLRKGLWWFEQNDDDQAMECWRKAGPLGESLIQQVAQSSTDAWKIEPLLTQLLAARSVRFLKKFGTLAVDLSDHFILLLHSDLLPAFSTEAFLESNVGQTEVWEWRAMVHMQHNRNQQARTALEHAVLPDGHLSVRGMLLLGDLEPQNRLDYLKEAFKQYPDSRLLHFVHQQNISRLGLQ